MKKKILILSIIAGFALVFYSCTKNFEEINTDPNNPLDAPSANVLAHAIWNFTWNYFDPWGDMNEPSSYSGQITKIQYIDEARYQYRESVVNMLWRASYNNINDMEKVIAKESLEGGNPNLVGMAMVWRAYMYLVTTDRWKDIPYSEACKLPEITLPKYDSQESIYNDLLVQLKAANDFFTTAAAYNVGSTDILFGGNATTWKKFCNSLRLRIAIRASSADSNLAKQHIEEILGDAATYPILASNADNVFLWWPGTQPYVEPWQQDRNTRDDHGMCKTLIDMLLDLNDPRLPIYAKPAQSDSQYRGIVHGATPGSFDRKDISRIGEVFRDNPAGFSPIMRYSEVLFIIAEAAHKGYNTGGVTAAQAYEAGVIASMTEYSVAATDYQAYLAQAEVEWDGTGSLEKLYQQKYISLVKNGQEAWAESRRTDFPLMGPAEASVYQGHNRQPFRYPYPTDEINLNFDNIEPALQGIVDQFWGQQMWWDKRTGVN